VRSSFLRAIARGYGAGFAGTTAMTATLTAEKWMRRNVAGPVDYDASPHVVTAASTALRWTPRTPRQERALFVAVHWGYGSAVGIGYEVLRRTMSRTAATTMLYAGCQAMAFALFPLLGGTPPPWRWRPSLLVSSLGQHAVYAVAVAATGEALRGRHDTSH
jgi:hypothetical protein